MSYYLPTQAAFYLEREIDMKQIVSAAFMCSAFVIGLALSSTFREHVHTFLTLNPIVWFNSNNFHAIDTHTYRSAQLSSQKFLETIKDYNIKAVLNLREPKAGKEAPQWHLTEKYLSNENGVRYINIPLNPNKMPSNVKLERMLELFERKKHRPFLIHCHAGADRTGMAAALYILEMKYGKDGSYIDDPQALQEALGQLRFSYGHYGVLHPAMKRFIRSWYELRKVYTRQEALEKYDPRDEKFGFYFNLFKLYKA